ncbi:glycine cleavage system protein GcvH [Solimicrobium silvestre]|uniref:Glycine cleavage system H protein n=1 Tax=Solimicrobium silvestre TaxID=2099400 RepID=A0A2S9GVB6_9BURK|nr:glycine cleavage system protein GcvH [Solimicrobium silvestre]PRC91650.1 gcvH: glycine cleavage system H protein [Solimicrobium silvestre]
MSNLKFTSEHEWLRLEDNNVVTVGITDYAQGHLGDLVYIQLPDVGADYAAGEEVAVIESVKTAGGIAMPFGGTVVEVNSALNDEPGVVNEDPLGAGWFFKMTTSDVAQMSTLMDEAAYDAYIAKLG